MERRRSILSLDSEAMKLARLIVKTSLVDVSVLESIVESHDKLTQAVITMRNNIEMVIATPNRVFNLQESIDIANEALQDRVKMKKPVKMREIDIDDGLNAELVTDDDVP